MYTQVLRALPIYVQQTLTWLWCVRQAGNTADTSPARLSCWEAPSNGLLQQCYYTDICFP